MAVESRIAIYDVQGQTLRFNRTDSYKGSYLINTMGVYSMMFRLDEEWIGLDRIMLSIQATGKKPITLDLTNTDVAQCTTNTDGTKSYMTEVPAECLEKVGTLTVGLIGYKSDDVAFRFPTNTDNSYKILVAVSTVEDEVERKHLSLIEQIYLKFYGSNGASDETQYNALSKAVADLQKVITTSGDGNKYLSNDGIYKEIPQGSGLTDEQVASAVNSYLTENPVQAYDDTEIKKTLSNIINIKLKDGSTIINGGINKNNEAWSRWGGRLAFGMVTDSAPAPLNVKSQEIVDGTIISVNTGDNKYNRWGMHVYEAYSKDKKSRITILVDKHEEEGRKVAEHYYYTGDSHFDTAYGWYRIGSDVKDHSFLFSRDKSISYGEQDFRSLISLANIDTETDLDKSYETVDSADAGYEPDSDSINNSKSIRYIQMKNARNGALFYDSKRNVPVMRINGKWCDLSYTVSPEGLYPEPAASRNVSYVKVTSSTGEDGNTYGYIGGGNTYNTDSSQPSVHSIVFPITSGKVYTVKKTSSATNRFKIGTMTDTNGSGFSIVFNDSTAVEANFTANVSGYAICTYTVSGESCAFKVLETD